jgi:hypothetical protein
LFNYFIDPIKLNEFIESNNFLISVNKELKKAGIHSEISSTIIGISKINHNFPMIIYNDRGNPITVIGIVDLGDDPNISEFTILTFIAKCLDIKITKKILVCIPSIREELKTLCFSHEIHVMEVEHKNKALELVKSLNKLLVIKLNES